ncbi:PepSY domain-containing protein [Sporosarcina sp. Te-1]|uniref:PepSY domain-containing protein n=1 Tax=Sporosarcina sp. Te-1 TaxID=2818390 RepID=UPI001A9E809E|nr:PepSY domain-containing protein [Sporosarcina sp. Te-1]QTD40456.1 PepSY domain-containing protein [Sporosarcina sp. Te-1]
MKKWMLIPALAGVVAVGSVALADESVSNSSLTAKQMLTLQQAKELAVQQVGGHVTEIELEKKKSGPVYEVEVESRGIEYELDIDALNGAVSVRKQQSHVPADVSGKLLSEEQAIAAAKKLASGKVVDIELDEDDDQYYYDIDLRDGNYAYDVKVDAITGEIVTFEKEFKSGKNNKQSGQVLTKEEALAFAKKHAVGNVKKIELDREDGRRVYEIEMKDDQFKYEIDLDAVTGDLITFEKKQYKKPSVKKTQQAAKSVSANHTLKVAEPATQTTAQKVETKVAPVQQESKPSVKKQSALSKEEAIAIAKRHASGVVTDIELDDGVWEIEMEDGDVEYELEIDAATGTLVSFEKDE